MPESDALYWLLESLDTALTLKQRKALDYNTYMYIRKFLRREMLNVMLNKNNSDDYHEDGWEVNMHKLK